MLGSVRLDLLDFHFKDFPDYLNGLRIPGNIWFRRFAVTYACICTDKYVYLDIINM